MKWGRGERGAIDRMSTITADELKQAEVTCEILISWLEFYSDEAKSNPRNRAAAARAELMAHCFTAPQLLIGKEILWVLR
jgi:hypothetical protein